MNRGHPISDELLDNIHTAIMRGENWMAYNTISYFLDKGDMAFFKHQDEANKFASNSNSEYDDYRIIHALSILDVFRQIPYENILSTQKLNQMNQENFDYLKDNIKYMGFGEKHHAELEKQLSNGLPQFQLQVQTQVNGKDFTAMLNFRKSDNTDMYFFNSYHASLQRSNGEIVDQAFYLNKGKGVTAKEAYNLLEGRSVFKELTTKDGEQYKAWIQLDFDKRDKNNNHEVKQFHENYGYDLKAAVSKFPINELADAEKAKSLIQSLQKGNIQSISIEKDGNASKMFVEANPQYKTVNVYDAQMKRMQKEGLGQLQSVHQSPNKEVKQEKKEDIKQDAKKGMKQKPGDDLDGPKKDFS